MNRSQTGFNIAVLAGVLLIAAILLYMPRHNYGVIANRIARNDQRVAALESGFEKINIFAGGNEEKRGVVLANLDSIASNLKKLDQDMVAFMEHIVAGSTRVEELSLELDLLQRNIEERNTRTAASGVIPAVHRAQKLQEEFFESLRDKAKGLSPRVLADMDFEEFMETLVSKGIVPAQVSGQLEKGKDEILRRFFSVFKTCIEVVHQSEQLMIAELVERATREGNFVEEDHSGERTEALQALPGGGTVYVKVLDGRRRRTFHLPTEKHVEFLRFEELRENAFNSILRALSISMNR